MKNALAMVSDVIDDRLFSVKLTSVQQNAMDSVLADINVDGANNDVEMADVAPRAVQKQEKQKKDKKSKKEKNDKVDDKKKRRHSEVSGEVEGEKKKKKSKG